MPLAGPDWPVNAVGNERNPKVPSDEVAGEADTLKLESNLVKPTLTDVVELVGPHQVIVLWVRCSPRKLATSSKPTWVPTRSIATLRSPRERAIELTPPPDMGVGGRAAYLFHDLNKQGNGTMQIDAMPIELPAYTPAFTDDGKHMSLGFPGAGTMTFILHLSNRNDSRNWDDFQELDRFPTVGSTWVLLSSHGYNMGYVFQSLAHGQFPAVGK